MFILHGNKFLEILDKLAVFFNFYIEEKNPL